MVPFPVFRTWLAVAVLAAWVFPAPAADIDKYLPDDTHLVVSVNVKQILASPLFAKHFQKPVDEFLKTEAVQLMLKDSGFDPLRDGDRLLVALGASSHEMTTAAGPTAVSNSVGVFLLLQGRFDPARLRAKAKQFAEKNPTMLQIHQQGSTPYYEINLGPGPKGLAAVLDKNTLVLTPLKAQLTDALDKAAGKKKTKLNHAALKKQLEGFDPEQGLQFAALRKAVWETQMTVANVNGKRVSEVNYTTLGDVGIEILQGGITVADDMRAKVALTAKDADKAKMLADAVKKGLNKGIEEVQKIAAREKEYVPLVDAMKAVQITPKGATITLEGRGGAEAVTGLVKALFFVRA